MATLIGKTFRATYCDGNCLWKVIKKLGPQVWLCEIDASDLDYGGTQKSFMTREIEASVNWSKRIDDLLTDHDKFYRDLVPGEVVHYHNGFQQYIRCEVVRRHNQNLLKPIAMVGDWKHELPRRRHADGKPTYCYHADKIEKGELFEPNFSNIYEHSPKKFAVDPRNLPALDISVPEMTAEQEKTAAKWQRIQRISDVISNERQNPDAVLKQISLIVQGK